MSYLLFRDHKVFAAYEEWDGKTRKYKYDEKQMMSLKRCLGMQVDIVRNFTFGDLLSFIRLDQAFFNDVFAANLGFCSLDDFLKEAEKPRKKEKQTDTGIRSLKIMWRTEWHDAKKYPSFDMSADFVGYGPYRNEITKKIEDTTWSLSFTTMNELVDLPLSTDDKLIIYRRKMDGDKPILEEIDVDKRSFTLYEMLSAIFFEISFFGNPKDRDKENKKLIAATKDVKKWKSNGVTKDGKDKKTGKKLFYSSDEMHKSMERIRKAEEKKHKKEAPALISSYKALLKKHKDTEHIEVKKLFVENKGNKEFYEAAVELNRSYQ